MLKSAGKIAIATDLSSSSGCGGGNSSGSPVTPGTPEPSTPGGTKPRKKLSFKEPEFFGYLKIRKPSFRTKSSNVTTSRENITHVPLNEDTFKEEDEDYEELEVIRKKRIYLPVKYSYIIQLLCINYYMHN